MWSLILLCTLQSTLPITNNTIISEIISLFFSNSKFQSNFKFRYKFQNFKFQFKFPNFKTKFLQASTKFHRVTDPSLEYYHSLNITIPWILPSLEYYHPLNITIPILILPLIGGRWRLSPHRPPIPPPMTTIYWLWYNYAI